MSQKSSAPVGKPPAEKIVRDIRRATRKHHSAEDKIRIVLEGLRGEESIAALCRPGPVSRTAASACQSASCATSSRWKGAQRPSARSDPTRSSP